MPRRRRFARYGASARQRRWNLAGRGHAQPRPVRSWLPEVARTLQAKALLATVIVLAFSGVVGLFIGSWVIQQQVKDHAITVAQEQSEVLAVRLRNEAQTLRQLMTVVTRTPVDTSDPDSGCVPRLV